MDNARDIPPKTAQAMIMLLLLMIMVTQAATTNALTFHTVTDVDWSLDLCHGFVM